MTPARADQAKSTSTVTVVCDRSTKGNKMVELDNIKIELNGFEKPLEQIRDSLNLEDKRLRVEELERNMEAPNFWDDAEAASASMKEAKDLKDIIGQVEKLDSGSERAHV